MTTFDRALAFVLKIEGGETNDPFDGGGHTRWGISQAAHTGVDVATLTRAQAAAIYRADYWEPVRGDELVPALALALFEGAVNLGVKRAVRIFQHAVGAEWDGVVGPKTVARASIAGIEVLPLYYRLRVSDYLQIVRADPDQERFLNGWVFRCFAAHQAALEL